jgi:fluoride exporter
MIWMAVAVAGALGAVSRYLLDRAISTRLASRLPWGTLVVNVSGSLAAGAVAGLATTGMVEARLQLVVAGGFLGAYTTFSTAMMESALLLEQRLPARAVANLLVPALLAMAAALAGWWLVT